MQRLLLAGVMALASLLGGCAGVVAQDHFSGRYRSVSGADHDILVVVPSQPAHWLLALQRAGRTPMPHPGGPMVEAPAAQLEQWFGAESRRMRCLVPGRDSLAPALCSVQPGAALSFRGGAQTPTGMTGWLLVVPKSGGIDVTELIKS